MEKLFPEKSMEEMITSIHPKNGTVIKDRENYTFLFDILTFLDETKENLI